MKKLIAVLIVLAIGTSAYAGVVIHSSTVRGDTAVYAGQGLLKSIFVTRNGVLSASDGFVVHDGGSNSGSRLIPHVFMQTGDSLFIPVEVSFSNGLYVDVTGDSFYIMLYYEVR